MSSSVKKLPKSQVEITITVPYVDYLKSEKRAIEKLSKEMKVDGFRSGQIPENIVREKTGKELIQSSTFEFVIPISYTSSIKEHDLQVIEQPKIDIKKHVEKEGDDFVYTAIVSILPEVKLGDYKKIKVKKNTVKVSEKEVNETIQMISDRFAEWKDVERSSKMGDRVEVDFEGFDTEGKTIPNTASKNHPVILGSKTMIPGFEEALVGLKKGEEKEFDIEFPKDYHANEMKGKKVKFKVKVNRVEEKLTKELDEALIEKVSGKKQSVEDFKKHVEDDLKKEMEEREQTELDNKVVQEIVKIVEVELPDSLIDEEIHFLKEERKRAVTQQGLTWEQYLKHVKKTEEDFAKDYRKPAEERLKARLAVNEIIKAEKIEANEEDVEKHIQELAKSYPEEQKKAFFDYYKKDSEAYRKLKGNLSADKLIAMFVE